MPGYALHVAPERAVAGPLWAALRGLDRPATVAELHRASRAHPNAIQHRLKRWQRAGFVVAVPSGETRYAVSAFAARPGTSWGVNAPLWNALVRAPATIAELTAASGRTPAATIKAVRKWLRNKLVIIEQGGPMRFAMTEIAPDRGTPPPVDARGTAGPVRTVRQRLWSAMRVLTRFELPALTMAAEASRRSAEDFINLLMRAGYLRIERRGNPTTGTWSTYCLIKRSGPVAPSIGHVVDGGQRCRRLRDPNSGETVIIRPARGGSSCDAGASRLPADVKHVA